MACMAGGCLAAEESCSSCCGLHLHSYRHAWRQGDGAFWAVWLLVIHQPPDLVKEAYKLCTSADKSTRRSAWADLG